MLAHELIKELPSKRRTIHELISYVDTIKETSANYGVFLGAGASVSSGIRSAVELVDEWRKEQYFKLNPTPIGEYDVATAKEWLIREQSNWYDPKKEYSSLFERAFDLKPQRRVFVEREVAKGFPSLGYAYLVKLIEKEFFNTIFTTNFDDLINEAFHQFSEIRPIVCAHDSSILNVTFTSKRPKIVKLHGDYLFDDIKTTLRETEALEKNTRDKFIQLTKEIGLIIIGFAGNDRSIMDVLEFLLKDETYVKNGIYWCFRKNDYIGEDLKKLLWRDRIFWVEIEGFDQIFAEMYASLCGDVLPIDTNPINQHTTKIYNEYLDNNFLKNSECQVITAHLAQLKKEKNSNLIADLLKTITNEDISNEDTSNDNDSDDFENLQIFLKLQNLESERKYKEVIIFTNQHINSVTDTALREKLLLTSFTASRKINDDEQSLKTADLLIELNPKNSKYYRLKSQCLPDLDDKVTVLDAAIKINTFSALNFESKANVIKEKMDLYVNVDKEKCFNELTLSIDKSLQINPSIDNDVWVLKFDSIIEFSKEKDKDKLLIEIINSLKIQSLYSPVVSKLILAYCKYKKTSDFEENDTVKLIDENKNKYYPENDVESINILIEALSHYKQKEQLEYLFSECELLKKVRKNRSYIYKKAEVIANLFADIPRAIKVITESQDYNKSLKLIIQLINLLTDLGQHEEAEKILNEHSDEISLESKLELQRGIFDSSDRIQEAIDCCLKIKPNKNNEQSRVTTLSYLYLRKGDYEAAKRTAKVFLEKVNYDTRYDATLLNYDYALFKLGSHLNKGRVDNVLKTTKSENVKGVCHLLLGDRNKGLDIFRDYFSRNFQRSIDIIKWPIVSDYSEQLLKIHNDLKAY